MTIRSIEEWDGDESEKSQKTYTNLEKIQILLHPPKVGVNNFKSLEHLRLIQLRKSGEGYSKEKIYDLEQETIELEWLKEQGVTLMNSPVNYLEKRYDFLDQEKLPMLKDLFNDGTINTYEFENKQQSTISEMNLIVEILNDRFDDNRRDKHSFPLINAVFEGDLDSSIPFLDRVNNYKDLYDFFCVRQVQIDNFNMLNELRGKINSELDID
jgi:hypothetical protein